MMCQAIEQPPVRRSSPIAGVSSSQDRFEVITVAPHSLHMRHILMTKT